MENIKLKKLKRGKGKNHRNKNTERKTAAREKSVTDEDTRVTIQKLSELRVIA